MAWATPRRARAKFAACAGKLAAGATIGFLLLAPDGAPVGVVNVNNPVWGALCGASLGYYAFSGQAGRGLFSAGLSLVIGEALSGLDLHRLGANVQPGNAVLLRCIRRLGFEREGFSRRFPMIGGERRDHERWALLAEDWPADPAGPAGAAAAVLPPGASKEVKGVSKPGGGAAPPWWRARRISKGAREASRSATRSHIPARAGRPATPQIQFASGGRGGGCRVGWGFTRPCPTPRKPALRPRTRPPDRMDRPGSQPPRHIAA